MPATSFFVLSAASAAACFGSEPGSTSADSSAEGAAGFSDGLMDGAFAGESERVASAALSAAVRAARDEAGFASPGFFKFAAPGSSAGLRRNAKRRIATITIPRTT